MSPEPHKRRWFQFRLRTLLILVVVLAIPLAWLAHERQKVRERNDWLNSLENQGAFIGYGAYSQPKWERILMGEDKIGDVTHLNLESTKCTDAELVRVADMTNLKFLRLENTGVTDAELVHLTGLTNLEFLFLYGTKTTKAGRQKLRQALPRAEIDPDP